jgi:trehalose/maltose hydrolase-like predicted phosphorylase
MLLVGSQAQAQAQAQSMGWGGALFNSSTAMSSTEGSTTCCKPAAIACQQKQQHRQLST